MVNELMFYGVLCGIDNHSGHYEQSEVLLACNNTDQYIRMPIRTECK
jgi:hypothetical protein